MISGDSLIAAGFTQRALHAWAGSSRLGLVAARVMAGLPEPATQLAGLLALFVGGAEVPHALVPLCNEELDAWCVEIRGTMARARFAILPVAAARFVVCDRLDAAPHEQLVCWPDDSSYHLARSIPKPRTAKSQGRWMRWLDLGTGSAFAPLVRPDAADDITATDVNPRAIELARNGLGLSDVRDVELHLGDLATGTGNYDLVTCNAPIPGSVDGPVWRATADDFVARLFAVARRMLARDATFVVHAALDALEPVLRTLPGERVAVAYTPADAERGFAVAWWHPDGEDRLVLARRALTVDHPHLGHDDRDAARAGTLPAL